MQINGNFDLTVVFTGVNIPTINPKKKRLRRFPCCPLGALVRSEGTWPMEQSTLERTWAWVGQVGLFWTNIGEK